MTAAVGLYHRLGLPQPWDPLPAESTHHNIPLIIYGAASAVGIFAVQLAKRSNIHPLLCVAGRAKDYVSEFLDASQGDVVIDYRDGDDAVAEGLKAAAKGQPIKYAFDAVAEKGSPENLGRALTAQEGDGDAKPKATFVLHGGKPVGEHVEQTTTYVGNVHRDIQDFGYVYFRYFTKGLKEGWFKGQRVEVVPGGLAGVQTALENLKTGKASAVKYVFRVEETEGAGKDTV